MDLSLALILVGIVVLGYGLYTKFASKQSGNQENEQKKTEEVKEKKKEFTYGKIRLFFGSQSGTASKFANLLEEEALQNDFIPEVLGVETYETTVAPNDAQVCIFLMATHGEGDPTDNAIEFTKWLKDEDRDSHSLKNMKYTVFGLGNTQYEHYNKMGKLVNKFLGKLGGVEIYQYGEGDDNSSLEDDFNDWKEQLWAQLKEKLEKIPIEQYESQNQNQQSQKSEEPVVQQQNKERVDLQSAKVQEGVKYDFQTDKFLRAVIGTVKDIREIRQNQKDGSTLHMEIDLGSTGLQYKTAQNLGIFVENSSELVNQVASYLNLDLEKLVDNPQTAKNVYYPSPISIREVLTYFCDFQGQLMKKTLKDLAKLCENEEQKKELEVMATAKGKQQFKEVIEDQKMTFFQLVQKYQVKLTFEQFATMTPRLSPRVFTISSSNLLYPNVVHVSDSILEDDLPNGSKKVGVCSQYFNHIYEQFHSQNKRDIKIRVDFRESSFKLPQDQSPVIMVGAGTGVAPFIAFCQDKEHLIQKGINIAPGNFSLYFGCRHEEGDYIFREQIQQYQQNGIINNLYTAFSRDQSEKVYVQDRILQNGDENYSLLFEKNATLFICGSMGMGKSVCNALANIISQKREISEKEALEQVKLLEDNKRIIKELW